MFIMTSSERVHKFPKVPVGDLTNKTFLHVFATNVKTSKGESPPLIKCFCRDRSRTHAY